MARVQLQPVLTAVHPAPHLERQKIRVQLKDGETYLETGVGAVCIPDIKVRRLVHHRQSIADFYFRTFALVLEPGEEAKLPPLPAGWDVYKVADVWGRGADAMRVYGLTGERMNPDDEVFVLTLDANMIENIIRESLLETEVAYFEDMVTEVAKTFFYTYRVRAQDLMEVTFDVDDECDAAVKFNLVNAKEEALGNVYYRRSRYKYITPRPVEWEWSHCNNQETEALPQILARWQADAAQSLHNMPALDRCHEASALNVARRAFAITGKARPVAPERHVFNHRKLTLEEDESLPFPLQTRSTMFNDLDISKWPLVLNTTRDGKYVKPKSSVPEGDLVFVHREEGVHRFIFWDHLPWEMRVGVTFPMVAIIPVAVEDTECAKQIPISPMRGMDPQITRAVAGNPYFASALQHAFNRRKYLHSIIRWDGAPWLYNDQPIMLRCAPGYTVRGSKKTPIGRRIARDYSYTARTTTENFLAALGENMLQFDTVQPVAPEERVRRAICLDL